MGHTDHILQLDRYLLILDRYYVDKYSEINR